MVTGCAPTELLAGGRDFFDALVEEVSEERQNGWVVEEMLASLIEVNYAQYRALLALAGAKSIPNQIKLPRPGDKAVRRTSIGELQKLMEARGGH